jgi:hypothetical protein
VIPTEVDGAAVLSTAVVLPGAGTGRTKHFRDGALRNDGIRNLAIARYDEAGEVYLFYCDADWKVLTDTLHPTVEAAVGQAQLEFGDVIFAESLPA